MAMHQSREWLRRLWDHGGCRMERIKGLGAGFRADKELIGNELCV